MNIAGERDGKLAIAIGARQYVVLNPAKNTVSRVMDESEVGLDSYAKTDNSLERRQAVKRQLDRATFAR